MKPFSHKIMMSVLAFVAAAGGYGGYEVVQHHTTYGANFETRPHVVEEVVDGDTLVVENGIRIRLLGVDAPESAECYGAEAKEALTSMVLGRAVVLEKDQTAKDGYDRLLRYVFVYDENPDVDNVQVNQALVRMGVAQSAYVKPNRRYLQQFVGAQEEARKERVGMWGACDIATHTVDPERELASDPFSDECVIKGNIGKKYTKDYFVPGCPNYKRVSIDPRKGEQWFCTEAEAQEAGWQRSASCNNVWQMQGGEGSE